jgi:hypothetical protein
LNLIFALPKHKVLIIIAEVAHLVEHDLAKVGVAGSSPVFRSRKFHLVRMEFFLVHPGGGIGRHAGLKILFRSNGVWVQLPSRVQEKPLIIAHY